jgi:glutamate-1-semialdehyde 2,1-aminomutase
MNNRTLSKTAYKEALKYIPGGVNSPVRALKSVGETPLFINHAKGCTLTDIDGNEYVDFCLSWGVFLLGHSNTKVNRSVLDSVKRGSSYGIPSLQETELAQLVSSSIPSMERLRFVNSGTEAVMSAIRLARGYTGRNIIVKYEGCYHGHVDHMLVSAGSGVAQLGESSSAGVPKDFVKYTYVVPYNDKESIRKLFKDKGKEIAAVIVEPVACNMGVVLPEDGFLQYLRDITQDNGALLIFDEVITGFRLSLGGAQKLFGIKPDLTTVGKIIGGGFPAAAFGGRADIMALLAPDGPVYQAGTLSGNPVAMSAGIATLNQLREDGFYENMERRTNTFYKKLKKAISGKGMTLNCIGPMFTLFFTDEPVKDFNDVKKANQERFAKFFRYMLENGYYVSPSQFEGNFISIHHTKKILDKFVELVEAFEY